MLARPCVLGGVLVRRVVATTRRAALLTRSQVDPARANFHALVALPALRPFDGRNRFDMGAGCLSHVVFLLFVQRLMYEGDCNRPLAHRRRHALDIAGPDIAYCEHSGQTRFEEMGNPGDRPMRGRQIFLR